MNSQKKSSEFAKFNESQMKVKLEEDGYFVAQKEQLHLIFSSKLN